MKIINFLVKLNKKTYHYIGIFIIMIMIFTISFSYGKKIQKEEDTSILAQEQAEAELRYNHIVEYYEGILKAEEDKVYSEAEYVAKLLYGQARLNSPDAQRAVVWLVINRVENSQFPNTVQEVVQQASQWMGYSDANIIEQDLYELALDVITDWHNGNYRPISTDFLYMSWSQLGITLRTEFKETNSTQYLYFK